MYKYQIANNSFLHYLTFNKITMIFLTETKYIDRDINIDVHSKHPFFCIY